MPDYCFPKEEARDAQSISRNIGGEEHVEFVGRGRVMATWYRTAIGRYAVVHNLHEPALWPRSLGDSFQSST